MIYDDSNHRHLRPDACLSDAIQGERINAFRSALLEMPEGMQAEFAVLRDRLALSFATVQGETARRYADAVLAALVFGGWLKREVQA